MTISEPNLDRLPKEELARKLRGLLETQRTLQEKSSENERLVHELRVHQVELEMQNRQLVEAQEELEQSRARYADLYDFAPVAYFTFDRHGVIQKVNLAGATLLGQPRARLVGSPFLRFATMEAGSAAFFRHLHRCADEGAAVTDELVFSTKSGRFETQATSVPFFDPRESFAGSYRTTFVDVSERNKAAREREKALRSERDLRSEQSLRQQLQKLDEAHVALAGALASSQSPMPAVLQVIVTAAREIVDAEYAALGVSEGLDKPFHPFVYAGMDDDTRGRLVQPPRPVGVFGMTVRERRPIRLRDLRESPEFRGFPPGHPTMTSFLGLPIVLGDHVQGSLYVANKRTAPDFTEEDQRTLERFAQRASLACEVAHLQDLTNDALRSRDLAVAVVSHDLRNPLNAIAITCATMKRGTLEGEQARRLQQIENAAKHMQRLVEDLLTATTIEAGMLSIQPAPASLLEMVEAAVQMVEPLAASRSLRIERHVDTGLPPALCERSRILQVLANLLGNAVKFSPAGEAVRVEARQEQCEIVISVADRGCGIAPDKVPHLFERYFKGEAGTGVGLGLYIAQGIVAAHGGRIWVVSEPGAGCTVWFTLPVAERPREGT